MFKNITRTLIATLLRWEARLVLKKYHPRIVGITGSVGKTGTKEAVAQVLAEKFSVRKSQKSFNHELGIPLTILNCNNAWWNPVGWLKIFLEGLSLIFFRAVYPEWLVLEIGVERPDDMRKLARWINFDVVIITHLPEIPVHLEFFPSAETVAEEKLKLAQAVKPDGFVILNGDDKKIMAVRENLRGKVMTYGWHEDATIRGSDAQILYATLANRHLPDGLSFKVGYEGHIVPFRIRGLLAEHQLYGVLAAVAVGVNFNLNLVTMASALENLTAPPGRFRLIEGIKETIIIDDSYNSSPAALAAGLATLKKIAGPGRKIAVLGEMMELGSRTIEAHTAAGEQAATAADYLVTVGLRTKFLAEAASQKNFPIKKMCHFDDWRGVGEFLQNLISPGDIIFLKGSQSVRLEKVVEEIMAHPEDKERLLVRQEPEWLKR